MSPQNNDYSSVDGVLFNKDKTIILAYAKYKIQTAYAIPNGVTSIGESTFSWGSGLTSINIPDSVTGIGEFAFSQCSGLTSINIPSGVTSIERYAFYGCKGLTSINIPDGVKSISESVFEGCNGLISINIPSGLTSIGESAFEGCRSLTNINIPSSVISIAAYAFSDCDSLTSINIPTGVTSIKEFTFSGCSSLTSINIPVSVTSIGYAAFGGCKSLTSVYYGGSEDEWNNMEEEFVTNESLLNANIYYNNRLTKSVVEINNDNIFLKTSINDLSEAEKQKSEVFVVLYDESGAVTDSYNAVYNGSEISGVLKNSDSVDHIKVFVWNKDGSLKPIINVPEYISL